MEKVKEFFKEICNKAEKEGHNTSPFHKASIFQWAWWLTRYVKGWPEGIEIGEGIIDEDGGCVDEFLNLMSDKVEEVNWDKVINSKSYRDLIERSGYNFLKSKLETGNFEGGIETDSEGEIYYNVQMCAGDCQVPMQFGIYRITGDSEFDYEVRNAKVMTR